MVEWRTARFLILYVLLMGALLGVIAGVRYYQGLPSLYITISERLTRLEPSASPTPLSPLARRAPRPDVNPVLTILENPPSIFEYVGHESNQEGQDYSF